MALTLGLILAFVLASPAAAVVIPLPLNPILGNGNVTQGATQLTYVAPGGAAPGINEFTIELTSANYVGTYDFQKGNQIAVEFDVTFGDQGFARVEPEFMMVFTSVRFGGGGEQTPSCDALGPGGAFQEANFDYVSGGFSGGFSRQTTSTDTEPGSATGKQQICNSENRFGDGYKFDSLVFDSTPGQTRSFGLLIEQDANLTEAAAAEQLGNLGLMMQGYRAVPEPNTGLLVLMGLVALATYSKSRRVPSRG